jgi:dolichol-phosphate mannosyltransferase
MKLSIIIPAYNEEKTITAVLKKLEEVSLPDIKKEIIVVNDGSEDNTENVLKTFKENHKNNSIHFFTHNKNQGKGAAVKTGITHATGDYILIQDADLEYNPNDIPRLLTPILQEKAKVVYGTRLNRLPNFTKDEKSPLFLMHYAGNRFLSLITSLLYGQWLTDMETGYKIFPKTVAEKITLNAKSFDFEPEITAKLLKKKLTIVELPISTNPRGYNEGKKLHAGKDGIKALWTLLKYRFVD